MRVAWVLAIGIAIGIGIGFATWMVAAPSLGETLEGRVVGVTDGDSLTLLVGREELKIRLAQIDAPERGQPYGSRSKQALSDLAYGRTAQVRVIDIDAYGRSVGEVYVDGVHVNSEMVRQGYAWAYTRYARSTDIIDLEKEARTARVGLWSLPEDQRDAPWVWRHDRRKRPPRSTSTDPRCRDKRTCGEMTSCAEAHFFHSECGLQSLDGDGDGVPCESLCR